MTRVPLGLIIALGIVCLSDSARALEANEPMSSWTHASPGERAALIARLTKTGGRRSQASIIACVDGAASVSGHMALQIGDVVKACSTLKDETEPV